jgi:Family of unknown function (DUF6282)
VSTGETAPHDGTAVASVDMAGGWDFYCHSRPCLLPRWGSAIDIARAAAALRLAGVVLQTHHESTHSRALAAAQVVPGVRLIGGLTLNAYAGGLSAAVVRGALLTGTRVFWLPTLQSRVHVAAVGAGYSLSSRFDPGERDPGLSVLDEDGALSRPVVQILDLLGGAGAVLNTGHAGLAEIDVLIPAATERGVVLVINHPYFLIHPAPSWWQRLPQSGVYVQLAAITQAGRHLPSLANARHVIEAVGPHRCVIGSESGGSTHPLRQIAAFCAALTQDGLAPGDVQAMLCDTPAELAGHVLAREPGGAH